MNILECCKTSIKNSVEPESSGYFKETSRRDPIGSSQIFYECSRCETRWVHKTLTHEPFTETWDPIAPLS